MHKDYLGIILAISDEAGNKLEQRHFDVWGNFTHLQIGNRAIKSTLFGSASAAITYGIGSVFVTSAGTATQIATELGKFGTIMAQGVAHAVAQGVLSLMQGQDFVSAFTSGLLGSYGASAFGAVAGKFASSVVGTIASGAVLGGVGSELTGGNFWQGAAIGGFVAGFNHGMHLMGDPAKKTYTINGKTYDYEGMQEYYATVIGESSNNVSEAQGIGEVILNRLDHKGADLTGGFIDNIGGADQYDAIGGSIYNKVMDMKFSDLLHMKSDNIYYSRFIGASKALSNWWHLRPGITNGAYIWNATWQKNKSDIGFNWRAYNRGAYVITAEIGQTTFFKYANPNKKWP